MKCDICFLKNLPWRYPQSDMDVKLDLATNGELDRIVVPEPHPEPHGLSVCDDGFLYCDATSGWVSKISW